MQTSARGTRKFIFDTRIPLLQLGAALVGATDLFLYNHVLGVDVGWSVSDTEGCRKALNEYRPDKQ